jgi:hypothetical protein
VPHAYRRIRLVEGNAKSLRLKSNLEKDFAAALYFSEPPFPPKFLTWSCLAIVYVPNLVTSECKSPEREFKNVHLR